MIRFVQMLRFQEVFKDECMGQLFHAHLGGIIMLTVLYGNEPYLIEKEVKKMQKEAEDFSFHTFEGFGQEVWDCTSQVPFFSDRQRIVVYTNKLEDAGFERYIDKPQEHVDMLVIPESVDKRKTIFKKLQKNNMLKECCKLNEKQLQIFIISKIRELGAVIREPVYHHFVERCGYLYDDEVNLFSVESCLMQLCMAGGEITNDAIDTFVEESDTSKIFILSEHLLEKDEVKVFSLAKHFLVEKESPVAMLSLLLRSFRMAYKASLYQDKSEKEISTLIGVPMYQFKKAMQYPVSSISSVMDILQHGVEQIKSGGDADNVFIFTLSKVLSCLTD